MKRVAAGAGAAVGCGLLVAAGTWRRIQRAGRARATGRVDTIVVLGAGLEPDGTPCRELAQRLDEGARIFEAAGARTILCCGGLGSDGISEAEAMRAHLVRRGVPGQAVLVDDEGATTRRAVAAVRCRSGVGGRPLFVSSHYHLHRVLREAERQSLEAEGHACPPAYAPTRRAWPVSNGWALLQAVREILAVWWYALGLPDRDRVIRRRIAPPVPQRLIASAATKWPVSIRVGHRSIASMRSTRPR